MIVVSFRGGILLCIVRVFPAFHRGVDVCAISDLESLQRAGAGGVRRAPSVAPHETLGHLLGRTCRTRVTCTIRG